MEHFHKTIAIFNKIVPIFYANACTGKGQMTFFTVSADGEQWGQNESGTGLLAGSAEL